MSAGLSSHPALIRDTFISEKYCGRQKATLGAIDIIHNAHNKAPKVSK